MLPHLLRGKPQPQAAAVPEPQGCFGALPVPQPLFELLPGLRIPPAGLPILRRGGATGLGRLRARRSPFAHFGGFGTRLPQALRLANSGREPLEGLAEGLEGLFGFGLLSAGGLHYINYIFLHLMFLSLPLAVAESLHLSGCTAKASRLYWLRTIATSTASSSSCRRAKGLEAAKIFATAMAVVPQLSQHKPSLNMGGETSLLSPSEDLR